MFFLVIFFESVIFFFHLCMLGILFNLKKKSHFHRELLVFLDAETILKV